MGSIRPTKILTRKAFINRCLGPDNSHIIPRGDYKEFLELSKILLGSDIQRKRGYKYSIQRPGADHHARWMSKAIYSVDCFTSTPLKSLYSYPKFYRSPGTGRSFPSFIRRYHKFQKMFCSDTPGTSQRISFNTPLPPQPNYPGRHPGPVGREDISFAL